MVKQHPAIHDQLPYGQSKNMQGEAVRGKKKKIKNKI